MQSRLRALFTERYGGALWRNNCGAATDANGNFFRYGLANDTPQVSKFLKSADLIGIRPVTITQDHVGRTLGQFVSREVKAPGWQYRGTAREKAQYNWAMLVLSLGGDAAFISSEEI